MHSSAFSMIFIRSDVYETKQHCTLYGQFIERCIYVYRRAQERIHEQPSCYGTEIFSEIYSNTFALNARRKKICGETLSSEKVHDLIYDLNVNL